MQKSSLSNLALVLVFLVIFFTLLTQRLMLMENPVIMTKAIGKFQNITRKFGDVSFILENSMFSKVFHNESFSGVFHNPTLTQNSLFNQTHHPSPLKFAIDAGEDKSPRKGTDISDSHQLTLLTCPNQSKCIVPELQLQRKFRVYFCKRPVNYGVRFYFLAREGLLLHPNVVLIDEKKIKEADFIIYLPGSSPWHKSECNDSSLARKLIVLDEGDGHQIFNPYGSYEDMAKKIPQFDRLKAWYFLYFKRSFVTRKDGKFLNFPHLDKVDVYPMVYSLAEAYIRTTFNQIREIDISCTLRAMHGMTTRKRVREWVDEYVKIRGVQNFVSGEVGQCT